MNVVVNTNLKNVPSNKALNVVSTEQAGSVVSQKMIKRAFELEKRVIGTRIDVTIQCLRLGAWLKEIRDDSLYKVLGQNSFNAWLETPSIDISHSSAYRYISIAEAFVLSGICTEEELKEYSISKLEMLVPYVEEMRVKAKKKEYLGLLSLSRRDLSLELKRREDDNSFSKGVSVSSDNGYPKNVEDNIEDAEFEELDFNSIDDDLAGPMTKEEIAPPGESGKSKKVASLKGIFKLVSVDVNSDGWKREPTKDILMNVESIFIQKGNDGEIVSVAISLDEKFNIFDK